VIYFDLLFNIIECNHHEPRSVYDFRKADYDAINDVYYSHPFNTNIAEANSAYNILLTQLMMLGTNLFHHLIMLSKHLFPLLLALKNKRNNYYPPHI